MAKLKLKIGPVQLHINHLFFASLGSVTMLCFVIPSLLHSHNTNSSLFGYGKSRKSSNVNDFSENSKMKQRKLRGFIERKEFSSRGNLLEKSSDIHNARNHNIQMFKNLREPQLNSSQSENRNDHQPQLEAPDRLHSNTNTITPVVKGRDVSKYIATFLSIAKFLSKPVINPHDFNYIHNPIHTCSDRVITTLFVVPSAISHFSKRRDVRASPLYRYTQDLSNQAAIVFFVGVSQYFKMQPGHHRKFQAGLDNEARVQDDIVQVNFTDTYHNMRLKAVSMLKWASSFCPGAKYVIRTDDDVTVVIDNIMLAIHTVGSTNDNFILGEKATHVSVDRAISSKYYVPKREYAPDYFPPFALGGLLGYPMKTVQLLYRAALRVPAVWLDDVYITALCAVEVNATLVSNELFVFKHGGGDL